MMVKKQKEAPDDVALVGQYMASGKHIGAGWVQLNSAHPVILMSIRHGLILLPEVENRPEGTKVYFAFEKNKNCLKRIGWSIAK